MIKVAIIGAGAAGCFLAQRLKELRKDVIIDLYEAHERPLMKVAVTGGGRCNLTNSFEEVTDLKHVYPRGHRLMKRLMHQWDQHSTMEWFERHGVPLVIQDDQCVFPVSQDAMQIVRTLQQGLSIHTKRRINNIDDIDADVIVVTTGGSKNFTWLETAVNEIIPSVPSLFPFKLQPSGLEELTGIVIDDVTLSLAGTKFKSTGTLLITHFGVSGPVTLRLSSYAARHLSECNYQAQLIVNWLGEVKQSEVQEMLQGIIKKHPDKQINKVLPNIGGARWVMHILERASVNPDTRCKAINPKQLNRLTSTLTTDVYAITGRAPHKEEFVTCGGISLTSVDGNTLESKTRKGLYFAGEVLDIDGVTGGFNLQAAFTTANAIAEHLSEI